MNLTDWVDSTGGVETFSNRLSLVLLHFIWQGFVIAAGAIVLSVLLRRSSATVRCWMNVIALMLMVVCIPLTFAFVVPVDVGRHSQANEVAAAVSRNVESLTQTVTATPPLTSVDSSDLRTAAKTANTPSEPSNTAFDRNVVTTTLGIPNAALVRVLRFSPYLAVLYFVGVVTMLIRLARSISSGYRLRLGSTAVDDELLLAMIGRQAERVGLSVTPVVLFCQRVAVPTVVGIVKPIVLLPMTVATRLTSDQLESLLAHEFAHIHRFDLFVNLLQRVIEAVLFFHPAVWFISRHIRQERENACDDLVLAAGWKRVRYADALVRMAELSSTIPDARLAIPATALAASGGSSSDLKRRVMRMLNANELPRLRLSRAGLALLVLTCVAICTLAPLGMQSIAASRNTPSQPETNTRAAKSSDQAPIINVATVDMADSSSDEFKTQTANPKNTEDDATTKSKSDKESPIAKSWGHLKGRFVLDGKPLKLPRLPVNKNWSVFGESLIDESLIVDPESRGIANVVLYLRTRNSRVFPDKDDPTKKPQTLTYKGGYLRPRVIKLRVDQPLIVKNSNLVAHSARLDPFVNKLYNVVLPPGGSHRFTFDKPERIPVPVADSIHVWNQAWIVLHDHPYMAISTKDGTFEIRNLPTGELQLQCWHERTAFLAARPEWKRGRFTITIRKDKTTDLGTVRIPVKLLYGRNADSDPLETEDPKQTHDGSNESPKDLPRPAASSTSAKAPTHFEWENILLGDKANRYIKKFRPAWGDSQFGVQIGLISPTKQKHFRHGERVPLQFCIRNVGSRVAEVQFSLDFYRQTPTVLGADRKAFSVARVDDSGATPVFTEKLPPDAAVVFPHYGLGIGKRTEPYKPTWYPFMTSPVAGKYKMTQTARIGVTPTTEDVIFEKLRLTTGKIEFQVVNQTSAAHAGRVSSERLFVMSAPNHRLSVPDIQPLVARK